MATVWIPTPLQALTGGEATVRATGGTVKELVEDLDRSYPGFKEAIVGEGVLVRPGISVVVDGSVVKKGLLHPVGAESEVFFIPAIGGG
ncbi:MAG: MoaD/ThiS family protein [Gammaproteobacteria bacterium]|nr:MoaD/ThiS family protein [Gammaproteobacteria bacterium]